MSTAPNHPNLAAIGQVAINVHDLDRAVAFYRDTLGLPFLFQAGLTMAFFDCAGVRLMLATPEKPEFDHPASIIYYRVDDIQAAAEALRARDVAFDSEPTEVHKTDTMTLWMAFLRDSEGNPLAMMSEVPVAP